MKSKIEKLMNMKSLLKFVPAAAMLFATGFAAQAASPAVAAFSPSPAKALLKSAAVRPLDIQEGETVFSYAPNGTDGFYGTTATDSYGLAIRITDPALVGAEIVGMRFALQYSTGIEDVSAWTSTTLGATPTGEEVDVTAVQAGWNEVRFTAPVEITAGGIYVGYSLTVARLVSQGANGYIMATGTDMAANGFYLSSENVTGGEWQDMSSDFPALSLQVILTGVESRGVDVALDEYVIVKQGEASTCNVTVANNTGASVSSVEYSYSIAGGAGLSGTGTETVAMSSVLGASANITIDLPAIDEVGEYDLTVKVTKVNGEENTGDNIEALPAIDEVGEYDLTVKVTKVNGEENTGDNIEATTKLVVTNLDIKHRAVVEEYTGTWCGYCPKGYVAMEYMAEKYPEDFIGLAYHDDDPMEGRNVVMPSSVTGFPAAHLDRASGQIDPYLGARSTEMGIEQDWLDRCNEPSPAAIEVEASLSDDLETVSVTSRTAFALEGTDGFKVAYALLADGMTGTGRSWQQRNYFGGSSTGLDLDLWDQFLNGGSYVTVEFNDVVILAPDSKGVTGSVPAEITVGEWNEHEYTFTLSDATSAYTASTVSLVQAPWKLRVVAMLLNADGEIVNAAKCNVSTPAGVNGVESSMDEPVEVARYSLDGRLLSEPERGVNIVKMSDGTARKVIVK